MEADQLDTEIESCLLERGSLDTRMLETDLLNMAPEDGVLEADLLHAVPEDGALEADLLSVESEAGLLEDDLLMAVSEVRASLRRRRVGVTRRARRAALRAGASSRPAGRRVRAERIEAGSDFASQFCSCDPPLVRLNRVNDIICESQSRFQSCLSQNSLTHNSHSTSARSLHAAHNSHARMSHARCVVNSEGDTEDGGRLSCVYGGTKSLSTCTRTGVRRPAVEKLASPQQASLKLHDETWAGLPMNLGPRIFREVEIVPGCAVRVACPSCPDGSPEPPGRGRVIRNMFGWSQMEKTERSWVWLFRGALQGENLFSSLCAAGDWVKKGSYHTAWSVPCDSSCTCSYAYGQGRAIGPHTGKRCWPLLAGVWRAIAPLMKPWCAEGDLPTATNLNLYRGWKSCVGWHCDDEPLFGKCGDAKLIVSVSLGNFALSGGDVSPVRPMRIARAGLTMVTFLSWMVNARTSFFIGRALVGNRIGLTLRSVGSNSMLPLVLCLRQGSMLFANVCALFISSCYGECCYWSFFGFFGFFLVSCAYGESSLCWSPCCVQDLGYIGVPPAGHALLVEFGGSITFVTSGENT